MRNVVFAGFVWLMAPDGTLAQAPPRLLPQIAYQRLDSLERVALTAATFNERLHAVTTIAGIAIGPGCEDPRGASPPPTRYPGIVRRLAGIYRQSQDPDLRHGIIEFMPMLAECAEVAAFLAAAAEEVPASPPPPPTGSVLVDDDLRGSVQSQAIGSLLRLGTRGEATLRRLHTQGTVREPVAKAALDRLARNGFRRLQMR